MLYLDGIRYAAEIADVAYERLSEKLRTVAESMKETSSRDIAMAIADAWTIVDSVHRFHDLITQLPGLDKNTWVKLFVTRVKVALELRDCVQHQTGEVGDLITGKGQIWGYSIMGRNKRGSLHRHLVDDVPWLRICRRQVSLYRSE